MDTGMKVKKSLRVKSLESKSVSASNRSSAAETSSSPPTTEFLTPPGGSTHTQGQNRTCSVCGGKKAAHALMCKVCYSAQKAKSIIELTCANCGEVFTRQKAEHQKSVDRHGDGVRSFCCRTCYDAYKAAHPLSYSKVKGSCAQCGKPVAGYEKNKFCSFECYSRHRSENRQRKEGYNGAFLALRAKVALRDGGCLLCGVDHGVRFEVHHVDFDPENNVMQNLVILCTACHRKYHQFTESVQDSLQSYFKKKISS